MRPIEFAQQNVVFAKDQPEYLPLPAFVVESAERPVTSCWGMTWRERLLVLLTGRVYFTQLTFGAPLQPQIASTLPPGAPTPAAIRFLLWVGFVARRSNGTIAWPFRAPPAHVFKSWRDWVGYCRFVGLKPYRFRNRPHVIKWKKGRLLPRRWGFGWLGFEFGDRGY